MNENNRPPGRDNETITLLRETINRLKRVETKVVRFAEEMGKDTDVDHDWMTVDDPALVIYVSTLSRSMMVMREEARKRGATQMGKSYDVVHKGVVVATLEL